MSRRVLRETRARFELLHAGGRKLGLAASLRRPGGNATGVAILTAMLAAKRVERLRELVRQATVVAVLVNPINSNLAESTVNECRRCDARP